MGFEDFPHVHAKDIRLRVTIFKQQLWTEQCRAEALEAASRDLKIDDEFDDLTAFIVGSNPRSKRS